MSTQPSWLLKLLWCIVTVQLQSAMNAFISCEEIAVLQCFRGVSKLKQHIWRMVSTDRKFSKNTKWRWITHFVWLPLAATSPLLFVKDIEV